jgi:hypothetical protein
MGRLPFSGAAICLFHWARLPFSAAPLVSTAPVAIFGERAILRWILRIIRAIVAGSLARRNLEDYVEGSPFAIDREITAKSVAGTFDAATAMSTLKENG